MANHKILRFGTAGQWMVVLDGDRGMPEGGLNRQILTKLSGTNFDAGWRNSPGFTFTQSTTPTADVDGQTWYNPATNNGFVWGSNQWLQFSWGDSESRYVNLTGDNMTGQLTLNGGGGETLELRPGTVDHTYIEFYARTATPASRSAYFGFPAVGSNELTLANSLPGDIFLNPSTGRVRLNADPTAALHAATKQYVDAAAALKLSLTGGTMTGILDFSNTLGTKIELYDGYTFGIEGSTIRYTSASGTGQHAFSGYINATSYIQSASYVRAEGGYVSADTDGYFRNYNKGGHRIRIGPWAPDTGWTCYIGNCGYFLMDHVSTDANAHLRAYNTLRIGGSSTDQLIMNSSGTSCNTSLSVSGNVGAGGRTTIGVWDQNSNYSAIMGHYGYHLLGGAGDGGVHTRGNLAGWNHWIGAGSLIVMEQWTNMALGGGSGGTVVQKGDGVLANAASRRALKERMQPLTDTIDAGAVIDALEPITFIWKAATDPYSQSVAMAREHRKAIVNDLHPEVLALAMNSEAVPIPDVIAVEVAAAAEARSEEVMAARSRAVGAMAAGDGQATDSEEEPLTEEVAAALLEEVAARIEEAPVFDLDAAEAWRQADVRIGLVAEDVADVLPLLANWVQEKDEDGNPTLVPGSWNDQGMTTMLVQAVKDLRARVAVLEQRS